MVDTSSFAPFAFKVALLVANGFTEDHMSHVQRTLTRNGIAYSVIAPEQGLVNSWQGKGWGHHFTVDVDLNRALGSDYEALIIPGGTRSLSKLRDNPHARRIVKHFFDAQKPILLIEEGIVLAALLSAAMQGRTVAHVQSLTNETSIQVSTKTHNVVRDGMLITATSEGLDTILTDGLTLINDHVDALRAEIAQENQSDCAQTPQQVAA